MDRRAAMVSAAVLTMAAALVGCARADNGSNVGTLAGGTITSTSSSTSLSPSTSTGTPPGGTATTYSTSTSSGPPVAEPPPQQCDGIAVTGPGAPLDPGIAVAGITLCEEGMVYIPGSGSWSSWNSHAVPAERLSAVVAALLVPSRVLDPGTACNLAYVAVPVVAVRTIDGTVSLAQVPSGGCHPDETVRALLYDVVGSTTPTVETVALMTAERDLRTGCLGAKPLYPSTTTGAAPAVPDAAMNVCDYVTGTDQDTVLRAAGPVDGDVLRSLLATLTSAPPDTCSAEPADEKGMGIGDFLAVVTAPAMVPPDETPVVTDVVTLMYVQTAGCHIVVDSGWTTLGWADPALVDDLMATTN